MLNSCIRGHHIFWSPHVGESLTCTPEFGNIFDTYAVAVVTRDEERTAGHVPRKISFVCHLFLRRGGHIVCQVTGRRQVTTDLQQGGLEVPCFYTFIWSFGTIKEIEKVQKLTSTAPSLIEPPMKKAKNDVKGRLKASSGNHDNSVDDDDPDEHVWIDLDGHIVTVSDEKSIINSKRLNDRHIYFAHKLLCKQFPNIEGLGNTLLQSKSPVMKISNGLQIIFDRGNHWIVASSIGCEPHIVNVYDSIYSSINENTKKVICNLFDKSKTNIVQVGIHHQVGDTDCGLFAIAIATSLLFGVDTGRTIRFKQHEMRNHLHDCFTSIKLIPFPS